MKLVLLSICLFIVVCYGQVKNICLYGMTPLPVILKPLQLFNTDCPTNTSYCMNQIYKYGNFQYNGISTLKPLKGEVTAFLTVTQNYTYNAVVMLNANVDVTSNVKVSITGAKPAYLLLQDDPPPNDQWSWNSATNTGNFNWTTKPTYTDGVVIGPIEFIDNYCFSASFSQVSGAINFVSVLSGSTKNVTRVINSTYYPGAQFQFCQYPVTATYYANATCPGKTDGHANLTITFGPPSSYIWTNSAGVVIAQTAVANNLGAGTYTVTLNDTSSSGCDATRTVTIYDNTLYGAFVSTTQFACSTKGTASASPNGGASGITFLWFTASGTLLGSGVSISGLVVGAYFVRTQDSCGSSVDTPFNITSVGCCGDGMCQSNEACGTSGYCAADCPQCCEPGTYINGASCTVCPPGSQSTTYQAMSCTSCPANTYNAGGSDNCTACPTNYYSAAGSGKCLRCAAGTVRGSSSPSCMACTSGYAPACDSSACTNCPAGSYPDSSAAFCLTCPAGYYSASGDSSCTTCAANSYSASGSSSCTPCPDGTSSAAGATHLLACNSMTMM